MIALPHDDDSEGHSGRDSPPVCEDLSIRFVNTVAWRLRSEPEERLPSPAALVRWFSANGLGDSAHLARVNSHWRDDLTEARAVYQAAIDLRESVYLLLVACLGRSSPPEHAISFFNAMISRASTGVHIVATPAGPAWRLVSPQANPLDLLKPVAISAAALMMGPRAHRIRQCQDNRGCGWLLVDESRAQNRRWCSMGDCGNRAKAHRHYGRKKQKASEELRSGGQTR